VFAPDWPIRTDRLVLRPFCDGDLDALCEIHADESVARWLYNEPRTRAQVVELLKLKVAGATVHAPGEWLSAAVEASETGELVGDVDLLWASEQHRSGELGFIVHPRHQGKGYATEAARPLLDWAFGSLALHRVIGRAEARGASSARAREARDASGHTSSTSGSRRVAERGLRDPGSGMVKGRITSGSRSTTSAPPSGRTRVCSGRRSNVTGSSKGVDPVSLHAGGGRIGALARGRYTRRAVPGEAGRASITSLSGHRRRAERGRRAAPADRRIARRGLFGMNSSRRRPAAFWRIRRR
jgi:RimJ/RimL family protein N-acetyltransferase